MDSVKEVIEDREKMSGQFKMYWICLQGYDDGYGGEYDDENYEAYEDDYSSQSKR